MTAKAPERSCISCRRKGAKGELIKLAATPAGVLADYAEKLPGRGAYVCPEPGCIREALDGKRLSRAFRENTQPPSYDAFMEGLSRAIGRRAQTLLGMARKAGRVAWGFDASLEAMGKNPGGLLVLAGDASENTLGRLMDRAPGEMGRSERYLDRDALGAILGTAPVAVVYVFDRGISAALRFELGRLKAINRG